MTEVSKNVDIACSIPQIWFHWSNEPAALAWYAIMSAYVEKQATGHHAISVQILTFRLVTLKVAHQFDVLVDVFKAFQLLTIVKDFHWVLKDLWRRICWRRGKKQKNTIIFWFLLCNSQKEQTGTQWSSLLTGRLYPHEHHRWIPQECLLRTRRHILWLRRRWRCTRCQTHPSLKGHVRCSVFPPPPKIKITHAVW